MSLLQIAGALIIGLVVGALAKFLVPGKQPGGCLITILLGIAGSFLAFLIGEHVLHLQIDPKNPLQPAGFLASLGGSILILVIYRILRR
jgi:uncharacterized membrane protein YeaQ/YmgE (transglycosylase-associated protein family)